MGAALAFMAAMTFAQVAARWCGESFSFTEELVKYLLVWITMLGIAVGAKRDEHIRVRFATLFFPRARRWLGLASALFACGLFGVLLIWGAKVVWTAQRLQRTEALNWPMWWVGVSIPIGGALAIVRTLQAARRIWKEPETTRGDG